MLEIACVAGLLIFSDQDQKVYYNPNQISFMRTNRDSIIVVHNSSEYRYWKTKADTKKEVDEAIEYAVEAWRECKKEWNK